MGGDTSADFDSGSGGETLAPVPYELSDAPGPLSRDELAAVDAWWRAANYLSVGQIYLKGNPLLREALSPEHIKPRLLGHFGTVPGLNLVWAHANRQIVARDLHAVFVGMYTREHGADVPEVANWTWRA
jgi:xylulose-5-phosphate/fructose-6-phosphate phosphoketolase